MEKLIIENRSDLPMTDVLDLIQYVVNNGKISSTSKGDQYCFATRFPRQPKNVLVYADKNKCSDRLIICDEP